MRNIENISIEDKKYKKYKKAWQYALDMTVKECNQSCEGFLHNMNSLQSRSGNQLPFSSINYGTCTLPEGRIIIESILNTTIKGTGKGMTSIFPCQIFQLKDGINTKKEDPNYDLFQLALKSSSKRMYPNYANCDWSVQRTAFEKSQQIKKDVLEKISKKKPELLKKIAQLPYEIQETLGFHIEDDGKKEIIFED